MMLDLDGRGALYRQTYRALRQAILDGRLSPGSRLPASRTVAREASLSRNTVLQAFEQLRAEGYVTARTGAGTFVTTDLPDHRLAVRSGRGEASARRRELSAPVAQFALSRASQRILAVSPPAAPGRELSWGLPRRSTLCDFRYGGPAYLDLPIATWSRIVSRRIRGASIRRLAYGSPGGPEELRRALADYLRRARGVVCEPEQVIVTYGTQQAVNLVVNVLVDPGDRVAIEEPHYPGFTLALQAGGAQTESVPVDGEGLRVAELSRRRAVKLVCVSPSHQFPTGALMPLSRRLELLSYAQRTGAAILEDDYDSEFRYDGRPVACLQGLDRTGCVIYAGSASKLLFPSLRIGWLVVPDSLVDPFLRAKAVADTGTASLDQLALADFIDEGHLERHLRRARTRNAHRRDVLLHAIADSFGDRATVSGTAAGLHVLLWLDQVPAARVGALRRACREQGVEVYSIAPYFREPPERAGLLLGYASLEPQVIARGIGVLAGVVRDLAGG
jgi:GntR family transcriptional regulator/MocR family aminotransferase